MDISATCLNLKCLTYAVGTESAHLRAGGVSRQFGGMLNPGSGHAKQGIAINPRRLLVLRKCSILKGWPLRSRERMYL